jgi:hypothetical protein
MLVTGVITSNLTLRWVVITGFVNCSVNLRDSAFRLPGFQFGAVCLWFIREQHLHAFFSSA